MFGYGHIDQHPGGNAGWLIQVPLAGTYDEGAELRDDSKPYPVSSEDQF